MPGDGKPDLVIANSLENLTTPGHTVRFLRNEGNATFAPAIIFGAGVEPWSVAAADLNGDGKPDLVVANSGSNTVSVLLHVCGP